jgi:hypothetical protein
VVDGQERALQPEVVLQGSVSVSGNAMEEEGGEERKNAHAPGG